MTIARLGVYEKHVESVTAYIEATPIEIVRVWGAVINANP